MKFVAAGGGTAGHVYPALAALEALTAAKPVGSQLPTLGNEDLLWIGSCGGLEQDVVRHAGVEFIGLAVGGLREMGPWTGARNAALIVGSVSGAYRVLSRFSPSAVLVTGGYASVSVTLAAWLQRIPVLVYLPDVVPGLAVRFLSHFASRVAATSEDSSRYLGGARVVATGYPVRAEVYALDKERAREELGLEQGDPTVLVFGGSRGARSINRALVAGLDRLLTACQVVHISGQLDAEWVKAAAQELPAEMRARYHPHAYLHEMPAALLAADLAVARAGAAVLGEFPAAGLPAVLVPYPHSGQHQQANADYMAKHGAARVLPDADVATGLVPLVLDLLSSTRMLAEMRAAALALARPEAAQAVAEQLCAIVRPRRNSRRVEARDLRRNVRQR